MLSRSALLRQTEELTSTRGPERGIWSEPKEAGFPSLLASATFSAWRWLRSLTLMADLAMRVRTASSDLTRSMTPGAGVASEERPACEVEGVLRPDEGDEVRPLIEGDDDRAPFSSEGKGEGRGEDDEDSAGHDDELDDAEGALVMSLVPEALASGVAPNCHPVRRRSKTSMNSAWAIERAGRKTG